MQTLPFFVLALTCLSALAETAVPPVPLAAQEGIVPAATPEPTVAPPPSPAISAPLPALSTQISTPAPTPSATESSTFDSRLLGGTNPVLTEQERAGVNITQAWRDKSFATMVSQPGTNGSVAFRFGESLPSIVCAILQLTDIELQPGEVVTQLNVGDSTRWSVESAVSGSGSEQIQHIIVKPRDIGLATWCGNS
jgi:hypothetical protein